MRSINPPPSRAVPPPDYFFRFSSPPRTVISISRATASARLPILIHINWGESQVRCGIALCSFFTQGDVSTALSVVSTLPRDSSGKGAEKLPLLGLR